MWLAVGRVVEHALLVCQLSGCPDGLVGGECVVRGADELEAGDRVGVLREGDEAKPRRGVPARVVCECTGVWRSCVHVPIGSTTIVHHSDHNCASFIPQFDLSVLPPGRDGASVRRVRQAAQTVFWQRKRAKYIDGIRMFSFVASTLPLTFVLA